jgi:hypothetical protein
MVLSFSNILKSILKELPANDYPVLNSRLFLETWLNFVLDSSLKCLIRFGQENDAKSLDEVMTMIPANTIAIMDRGYASWDFVNQMSDAKLKFVLRIKNNMKIKFDHDKYRVVKFYDAQNSEYRLATNLIKIPLFYGNKLLEKFRYIQIFLHRHCSLIH